MQNGIKIALVLMLLLKSASYSYALKNPDPAAFRQVRTIEYKMEFYVLTYQKKIKYKDDLIYTWFKSQKIHSTQGNAAGYLLHGTFSKFHINGQLAESGEFEYGLKVGKWSTWSDDGFLVSTETFKSGRLKGVYILYSNEGIIIEKGKNKKNKKKLDKEFRIKDDFIENDSNQINRRNKKNRVKSRDENKDDQDENKDENSNDDRTLWKKITDRINELKTKDKEKTNDSDKDLKKPKKEKKAKEDKPSKPKKEK